MGWLVTQYKGVNRYKKGTRGLKRNPFSLHLLSLIYMLVFYILLNMPRLTFGNIYTALEKFVNTLEKWDFAQYCMNPFKFVKILH